MNVQGKKKSRNNAHLGPNLPSDHEIVAGHNETFDSPNQRLMFNVLKNYVSEKLFTPS
jgi:hypothetical protein